MDEEVENIIGKGGKWGVWVDGGAIVGDAEYKVTLLEGVGMVWCKGGGKE